MYDNHVYYGGNQSWFTESFGIPSSGCGLIAGADALLYLCESETEEKILGITKTSKMVDNKLRYLYTYEQYQEYIHHMERDYLSLMTFGVVTGIPGFILYKRLNEYFDDVKSSYEAIFHSLQFKEMTDITKNYYKKLIAESIKENKPALLLIGSKKATFYEGKDKNPYKFHWVTVTDVCTDYYTGDTCYTIISWGNKYTLPSDEFFDNIGLLSGMVIFD